MTNETYPESFSEYVGQSKAKQLLQSAAESARIRQDIMPHFMITSPQAGVGKTALAHLVAKTIGTKMVSTAEAIDTTKFRRIIFSMRHGDVLLLDELHRNRKVDWLHLFLQDGLVSSKSGELEKAPRVTVIGATTNPELLDPTITSRFQFELRLQPYSYDEALTIASFMAERLFDGLQPFGYNLTYLVRAANCNPRTIKQLLLTTRDLAISGILKWEGDWDIQQAMDLLEICDDGLTHLHIRYLDTLVTVGGQAGLDTLVSILDRKAALPAIERVLLERGFIKRESTGRMITADGRDRLDESGQEKPWERPAA